MIDEIGILKYIKENTSLGVPYLIETWQQAVIDASVWTTVLTAGGTATRSVAEEPYQKVILDCIATANAARLHTNHEWQLAPDTWGANTFNKLLIMEWEAKLVDVDDIDHAGFLMGLTAIPLAIRTTDDIAVFILDPAADALHALTDTGASETSTATSLVAADLTSWHKYGIVSYSNVIEFWVDEVMEVRHNTTPVDHHLPDINAHGNFLITTDGDGVGAAELHIATISIRPGVLL